MQQVLSECPFSSCTSTLPSFPSVMLVTAPHWPFWDSFFPFGFAVKAQTGPVCGMSQILPCPGPCLMSGPWTLFHSVPTLERPHSCSTCLLVQKPLRLLRCCNSPALSLNYTLLLLLSLTLNRAWTNACWWWKSLFKTRITDAAWLPFLWGLIVNWATREWCVLMISGQ